MELHLKPSDALVSVNGTLCREWHGQDDQGREVVAYICAVRVPEAQAGEFDRGGEVIEIDRPHFG